MSTSKYTKNTNLKAKSKQPFIKNTLHNKNQQSTFYPDLCQAMLESETPLWKLNHPSFKNFLGNILVNDMFLISLFLKIMFPQFMKILFFVFVWRWVDLVFNRWHNECWQSIYICNVNSCNDNNLLYTIK